MKLKRTTTAVLLALTSCTIWSQSIAVNSSEASGPLLTGKVSTYSQGVKAAADLKGKSASDNKDAKQDKSAIRLNAQKVSQKTSRSSSVRKTDGAKGMKLLDAEKKSSKETPKALPKVRQNVPELAKNHHDFEFFDARAYLLGDLDNDGYYSEFQVEFDADTVFDWAEVYAKLYISQNGGPWEYYYTTDVFEINGSRSDDDYRVTTTLNANYPAGSYDLLVDLYEYGFSGIVATISANDDSDLYNLPLEDRTQEVQTISDFSIYSVTTDLLTDLDNDGFFSEFAMAIDIDTRFAAADVFIEVYFLNEDGNWELDFTSDSFTIEGESTLDTQHFEFEWLAGYPTEYYDFKVVVVDAQSNEELSESFSEFNALNGVPLESVEKDDGTTNSIPPSSGGQSDSSSRGSGGGSWGFGVLLLSLPWLARKRQSN